MIKRDTWRIGYYNVNDSKNGEYIEAKMRRALSNKEAVENVSPMTYTERAVGVLPELNIRTDRFEVAMEAMGAAEKGRRAIKKTLDLRNIIDENESKEGETPANT